MTTALFAVEFVLYLFVYNVQKLLLDTSTETLLIARQASEKLAVHWKVEKLKYKVFQIKT